MPSRIIPSIVVIIPRGEQPCGGIKALKMGVLTEGFIFSLQGRNVLCISVHIVPEPHKKVWFLTNCDIETGMGCSACAQLPNATVRTSFRTMRSAVAFVVGLRKMIALGSGLQLKRAEEQMQQARNKTELIR